MKPYFETKQITLYQGDSLQILREIPDNSIHTVITSPPYFFLCDYDFEGQIGLELSLWSYLEVMVKVFREVRRVLVNGGVCWVVIGDTQNNYSAVRKKGDRRSNLIELRRPMQEGYREKEQLGIPYKLVDAMRADGWLFRREMIWDKVTSGLPANSDTAALTHESILQFGKWDGNDRPYLNCKPILSSVFTHKPESDPVHPCPMPRNLALFLMLNSSENGDTVLDPFAGSGTVLKVASEYGRRAIGIELNPKFCDRIVDRCNQLSLF